MRQISDRPVPRPLRCVLFDLDGTLVDSRADLADAVDAALERNALPALGQERIIEFVGAGARNLIQRALQAVGATADRTEAVLATFFGEYRQNHLHKTRLYPHVEPTLQRIHALGLKLGLVSNKPYEFSASLLRHFGLAPLFTAVLGGDSLPQRKPDPRPLLAALEACGAGPAEALLVGDGEHDMQGALAAGIYAVGVTYGFREAPVLIEAGADVLLDGIQELTALL